MEPIIEICNVTKEYRLGAIGGTTLNAELQSKIARLLGREDPNKKIGTREGRTGERFLALDGISFSVQPGEAVGIIGHNGAGKSTLLKLISRVTAPSGGEIRLRGRVASMLEVGTGFHPELTGRENVYLNGAILGMTKKEIDAKFDEIVDFAEMRQFIDTPVKRYSSGMYVKLAFSVAAHLDSEIMIMDEVLAVGDAKFQQKCLGKMSDEAGKGGRTVLYVSHNMNTIQSLCTRVIVLDHGRIVYDGDTAGGIAKYLATSLDGAVSRDLSRESRDKRCAGKIHMNFARFNGKDNQLFLQNSSISFHLDWETYAPLNNVVLRFYIKHISATPVAFTTIPFGNLPEPACFHSDIEISLQDLVPGQYYIGCEFHEIDFSGKGLWHDYIPNIMAFEVIRNDQSVITNQDHTSKMEWSHNLFGSIRIASALTGHRED